MKISKDSIKVIEPLFKKIKKALEKEYIVTRTSEFIDSNTASDCHVFVYIEPRKVVIQ